MTATTHSHDQIHATVAAATVALALGSFDAHAVVLVSNLDQPTQAMTLIPTDAGWAAQSFVTDGSGYALLSVDVLLGKLVVQPSLTAELHAGGITSVGALLATFGAFTVPAGSPTAVTLATTLPVALAANTTYWVVLGTAGVGSFGWSYAKGGGTTGAGSLGNYAYSSNAGASWGSFNSDDPYQIRVNVSAVPEPSAFALWAGGLAALGFVGRRRRPG
jgi:hypothetical protein